MSIPTVESPPSAIETMERQPSLIMGLIGGTVAMVISAAIWGAITYFTKYQITWMSIGLGFLVGFGVRTLARGSSLVLGLLSAVLSLIGCLLGNLFYYCGVISQYYSISFVATLLKIVTDPATLINVFKAGFQFMDLLFYAVAIYVGFQAANARQRRTVTVRPPA